MINVIDLKRLNYEKEIKISEEVVIPLEYLDNTDIVSLSKIKVEGNITYNLSEEYLVKLNVSGTMQLHDAITYEICDYPFTISIEETLENLAKTLDLIPFLWHYIILEVPLRFTNSEIDRIENENYRVISEEEYQKKNNPFSDFFLE